MIWFYPYLAALNSLRFFKSTSVRIYLIRGVVRLRKGWHFQITLGMGHAVSSRKMKLPMSEIYVIEASHLKINSFRHRDPSYQNYGTSDGNQLCTFQNSLPNFENQNGGAAARAGGIWKRCSFQLNSSRKFISQIFDSIFPLLPSRVYLFQPLFRASAFACRDGLRLGRARQI